MRLKRGARALHIGRGTLPRTAPARSAEVKWRRFI